jgi:hypothetical protein
MVVPWCGVRFPQYVYRNGALVDTGGVNWFYLGRNAVFYDDFIPITGPPQSPPPVSPIPSAQRNLVPAPESSPSKGSMLPATSDGGGKKGQAEPPITNEQGH